MDTDEAQKRIDIKAAEIEQIFLKRMKDLSDENKELKERIRELESG